MYSHEFTPAGFFADDFDATVTVEDVTDHEPLEDVKEMRPSPAPLKSGSRSYDDGSSWMDWWVFPRLTDAQIEEVIEEYDITPSHGGPGNFFARRAGVTDNRSRTLIVQWGGYDV